MHNNLAFMQHLVCTALTQLCKDAFRKVYTLMHDGRFNMTKQFITKSIVIELMMTLALVIVLSHSVINA